MAEKNIPNTFGGFEALAGDLLGTPGSALDAEGREQNDGIKELDPEELKAELDETGVEVKEELDDDEVELEHGTEKDEPEENPEEPEETGTEEPEGDGSNDEEDELDTLGEYEAPMTKLFREQLFEELGWETEEGEEFESVSDLVEYMNKAVSEAAKPQYASQELQDLDAYVRQGGRLDDYFTKVPAGQIDLEDPDLTDVSVQKQLVTEYLSNVRGYNEARIKRTIERWEDKDSLEEEAEDALELLKEFKEDEKKRLLADQENYAKQVKEQQQKFYSDVVNEIEGLTDIRGHKLTKAQKQDLLDYIFKPGADGRTRYQVEYAADTVRNLLESAFFTKDKKTNLLVNKAKQSGKSEAVREMRQKLKASKGKRQKNSGSENSDFEAISRLGQSLIKKV